VMISSGTSHPHMPRAVRQTVSGARSASREDDGSGCRFSGSVVDAVLGRVLASGAARQPAAVLERCRSEWNGITG